MKLPRLALHSVAWVGLLSACSSSQESTKQTQWRTQEVASSEGPLTCSAATLPGTSKVRLTLSNHSNERVELLKWGTPWDAKADAFTLVGKGGPASFRGLVASRRGEPPGEAFLPIIAGDAISIEYDVGSHYALTRGENYEIALKRSDLLGRVAGETVALDIDCGSGTVQSAAGEEGLGEVNEPLHPYAAGCSPAQEAGITAMALMASNATRAAEQLTYPGSPLYDRWFGDWTAQRANSVHAYIARYNTLDWAVRCGGGDCCDDPATIGCMDPGSSPDRIYVCPRWWHHPEIEMYTQSRVETLIHEHTHLDASGLDGTEDIRDLGQCGGDCYGYWNALSLANDVTCVGTSQNCKAVRNATNHAFFASDALFGAMTVASLL